MQKIFFVRHRISIQVLVVLIFAILVICFNFAPQEEQAKVEESMVKFISKAPLETIIASSTNLNGILDTTKRDFLFRINMGSFSGFKSPLQKEHFEENYLEIDKYRFASFTGKIIEETSFKNDGLYEVRGKGIFNLHGVSQEKTIKCLVNVKNGIYTVSSTFNLKLNDYKILIPYLVQQKIADEITVSLSIKIK